MSNNTSTESDERVELFEEGLDSPLPSSGPNEAGADLDGRGVTVIDSENLPVSSTADDDAVTVDNPSLATDGSSPMVSTASRPSPELMNDSDGPPLPVVIMASMLETTKGTGEHNRASARRPAGVEQIDNDGGPLPAAANASSMMLETTKGTGEHNRVNVRRPASVPLPPAAMDSSLFDGNASNKVSTNDQDLVADNTGLQYNDLGEPTELMPPAPFNPFMFEEHAEDNKLPASLSVDNDNGISAKVQQHDSAVIDHEDDEEAPQVVEEDDINSTGTIDIDVYGDVEDGNIDYVENGIPIQRELSIPGITEAYPVDDNIIIATRAEPTLPWRKQRRTKLLLVFVFVVVAVLAIALGVASSSTKTVTELVALSSPPSLSAIPTFEPTTGHPSMPPTTSPSSSRIPSTSPSSCSYTISTNMQKLDLLRPDPGSPKTAIDGRNLVVVSRDITSVSDGSLGSLYVIFYSLSDDNEWAKVGFFVDGNIRWGRGYSGDTYDVALSGKTAVVGLPSEGVVNVYEKNDLGIWAKVNSPQPSYSTFGFGQSVDIDGDLMVVAGYWFLDNGTINEGSNEAHVFKRSGGEWLEIAVLSSYTPSIGKCFVKGDIIVISDGYYSCFDYYSGLCEGMFIQLYKYDKDDDSVLPLQRLDFINPIISDATRPFSDDPIRAINSDHLVYWNTSGVFIYHTQEADEPFTLVQYLNSSGYGESFGRTLTMDKGIMVVGGVNRTHFFSQQNNEIWEEVLTLDQSYDHYQISGRTLIAANKNEVYAMNIADCTQPIPTQMPSVSLAPTTCYRVEFEYIDLTDCDIPWEATIEKIDSDVVVVKTWLHGYEDNTVCLNQGQYQFTLRKEGDSNSPLPGHHYSIKSNGWVIAQGAIDYGSWIDISETTLFDIPFDPTTATAPTGRPYAPPLTRPPTSVRPTNPPTLTPATPFPTESMPPTPPTPPPVPDTGGFRCPDPSFVGCTAPNPSNLEDECPTIGEPCPNGSDGEFCCEDGCPRNYCTAKQSPPTPPSTSFSPTFPITSFSTPFRTSLQPSTRPATSTTITPSDQEPASSITPIKACLMQSECEEQSQMTRFTNFYAGSYADYGCFSKGGNLYWGIGGSDAQKAISPLGGVKERVWCD